MYQIYIFRIPFNRSAYEQHVYTAQLISFLLPFMPAPYINFSVKMALSKLGWFDISMHNTTKCDFDNLSFRVITFYTSASFPATHSLSLTLTMNTAKQLVHIFLFLSQAF